MTQRSFRVYILASELNVNTYRAAWAGAAPADESSLWTLAEAIANSPIGAEFPNALLVVRSQPTPVLALFGEFDDADDVRVQMLRWEIEHILPTMRYIGYAQAEKDCELLAARLIEQFGHRELQRFRYVGIPRGGLIVLGMLAYALGLSHEQLESGEFDGAPVVIVDDCALTGQRFGRFLLKVTADQVIFAHLYSHPTVRQRIVARESRVIACHSAHDLVDLAPARLGDEYKAWRQRWEARDGEAAYWIGQPEDICFAWNEPDSGLWNPVVNRQERGWQLLPPALCLKHRAADYTASIPIQRQPVAAGPLRPARAVLFGELNDQVIVGNVESGAVFCLTDVAADLWRAIVRDGDFDKAIEELGREYDVAEPVLREDVHALVAELVDRTFLEN